METSSKEGWHVILYKSSGQVSVKFQVNDLHAPSIRFQKKVETVTSLLGQWLHYVLIYKYSHPTDASANFQIYKNGLSAGGHATNPATAITGNMVHKLGFGCRKFQENPPKSGHAVLDDIMIFNGTVDALG